MCVMLERGQPMMKALFKALTDTEKERDEARKCAEQLRDMLSALDEVTAALPLPWEVEDRDADSNFTH